MALGEYQCLADAVLEIEAKLCSAYLAAPQGFEPRYADPASATPSRLAKNVRDVVSWSLCRKCAETGPQCSTA